MLCYCNQNILLIVNIENKDIIFLKMPLILQNNELPARCNLLLEFLTLEETNFLQRLKEFSFYDTIYTSNIDFEDFNAIWIHLKAFYA